MAYEIHKYCDLFPDMTKEEFIELKKDIHKKGLEVPIWVWGSYVVDGKNRMRACEDIEGKLDVREWRPKSDNPDRWDGELLEFVISQNLQRRHLTVSQRSMIAADIANMHNGGYKKNQNANLHSDEVSREKAAKQLGVSERNADAAATVKRDAEPEVVEAVKQGDITVNDASKIKDLPAKEQKAAVKAVQNGHARTAARAARNGKEPKPETNGKPFDDNSLQSQIGKIIRAVDARASSTHSKSSDGYKRCHKACDELADGFKEWRKETAK